jgi:preprotein translocase subunit SecA
VAGVVATSDGTAGPAAAGDAAAAGGAAASARPSAAPVAGNGHGTKTPLAKGLEAVNRPSRLQYSAPAVDGEAGAGTAVTSSGPQTELGDGIVDATGGEPARNAPCPCGSGRKYKRCHGDPTRRAKA